MDFLALITDRMNMFINFESMFDKLLFALYLVSKVKQS